MHERLEISCFERKIVWTWTHKLSILERTNFFQNARESGHKVFWTHDRLDMNAQIKSFRKHEFSFGTHKSLDIGNFERTKVWTWGHLKARWTHKNFWTHESLDIGTFRMGGSGHWQFPSGTVWTYRISVWHLNLSTNEMRRPFVKLKNCAGLNKSYSVVLDCYHFQYTKNFWCSFKFNCLTFAG